MFPAAFARADGGLQSHRASYDISLYSTAGGAAGVVTAKGKMRYQIQKVCGVWETESVFSIDVGYEQIGLDTTNWKQTTRESADGCRFDFTVYVREKGADRKDLSGTAVCDAGKKRVRLTVPVASEAVLPKSVAFPVQQTLRLLDAARAGKGTVFSYVYDGTRPESLFSTNTAVTAADGFSSPAVKGDADLVKDRKAYCFDTAFFEEFAVPAAADGAPAYEVSLYSYDNGISDQIVQNFGTHRLLSVLTDLERLPDKPCAAQKTKRRKTKGRL